MSRRSHDLARRLWAGELGGTGALLQVALAPAEGAYRLAVRLRGFGYDRGLFSVQRAAVPVISVGNVAVGGTGKTPFASWLARRLAGQGRRPAVLHGGYADDEPELHRRWAPDIPVIVNADRAAGAAAAAAAGADVVVLDDGFQHRRLHRNLDIVLVSAERWRRRPRLLPRGPWREAPAALQRADMIVVSRKTAPEAARDAVLRDLRRLGARTAAVHLKASGWRAAGAAAELSGGAPAGPAVLVCGVAEPEQVARNAADAGAVLAETLVYGDHHAYTAHDAAAIAETAAGRPVITTEKDWTKLELWLSGERVWLLTQEVVVEQGLAELDAQLTRVLA